MHNGFADRERQRTPQVTDGQEAASGRAARGGVSTATPDPLVANRSGLAFAILAAGVELGLLANGLLRVQWGVNLAIWVAALGGAMLWIAHTRRQAVTDEPLLLAIVATAFAGGLALRATEALAVLNVLAALSALVLLAMAIAGGPATGIGASRVRDVVHAWVVVAWRTATGGVPLVLRDARVRATAGSPRSRQALAVLRGVLLATPLLIVFGSLFMAADAAFNDLVVGLIGFDFETIASHLAMIAIFAWISAGYLHGAMLSPTPAPIADPDGISVGAIEALSVLILLDLLFATFIGVQAGYLFGGGDVVAGTAGLSYAEYARRGFFEMAVAAALAVPVLLTIHVFMRRETARHEQLFRAGAGLLAALVGLVMLSAAHRMALYQNAYGLTESRLYASAFMIWIGLVLAWFGWTVLRGDARRFAAGALISGWVVLGGLNVANPDHLIARTNLERARGGASFDFQYVSHLGADAVPAVIEALRTLPPEAFAMSEETLSPVDIDNVNRCELRDRLKAWQGSGGRDWRSWNAGRARARQAVRANAQAIDAISCRPVARDVVPAPGPPDAATPPIQSPPAESPPTQSSPVESRPTRSSPGESPRPTPSPPASTL